MGFSGGLIDQSALCSITLALQYEVFRVVDEAVGNRCGSGGSVKNVWPLGERQIGSNHGGFFVVPCADNLEKHM